jgi:hypothetical protein
VINNLTFQGVIEKLKKARVWHIIYFPKEESTDSDNSSTILPNKQAVQTSKKIKL